MPRKPDQRRGTIAFIFIVLLGYLLGFLIKRVQLGLILGLAVGLMATVLVRRNIPFFKTWTQWYVFVILFLVVLIVVFWLFTKYFS
jgi:hypothetical protein